MVFTEHVTHDGIYNNIYILNKQAFLYIYHYYNNNNKVLLLRRCEGLTTLILHA
jgi:hypothetical protein